MRKQRRNRKHSFAVTSDDVDTGCREERPSFVGPAMATSVGLEGFHRVQQKNDSIENEARVDHQYFTKAIDTHFLGGSYSDIQDSNHESLQARRQKIARSGRADRKNPLRSRLEMSTNSSESQNSSTLIRMQPASGEDEMEISDDRTPLLGTSFNGYGSTAVQSPSVERFVGHDEMESGDSLMDIDHDGEWFFLIIIFINSNIVS